MNPPSLVIRIGAAVVAIAALAGWTPPATADAVPASSSAPVPTEPAPVTPIAVSGRSILVEYGGTYRLSSDGGKTWRAAKVPCRQPDPALCDASGKNIGTVASGVVAISDGTQVDAYSLARNAAVGKPYTLIPGQEGVFDANGSDVLLYDVPSASLVVRSLVDGSTREIPHTSGNNAARLLADGSVLARTSDGSRWELISPSGSVSAFATTTSWPQISGTLVAFGGSDQLCTLETSDPQLHCRTGLGPFTIASVSPYGVLIHHGSNTRWVPVVAGEPGSPKKVTVKLKSTSFSYAATVENAYPVITRSTASSSQLVVLRAGGAFTTRHLPWARVARPVVNLQLTPTVVLGQDYDTPPWLRSATSGIGTQRSLGTSGMVAAQGARWVVDGNRLSLYDHGRRTSSLPIDGDVIRISGSRLLVAPSCNPPMGDTAEGCPTFEVHSVDGRTLATIAASDIFGDLALVPTGSVTGFEVRNYLDAAATRYAFELPAYDGAGSAYQDLRIWGDWVAGTSYGDGPSGWHAVAYNYRTGQLRTTPEGFAMLALGDGLAVVHALLGTNVNELRVWNLADGSFRTLSSSVSTMVAVDGARVAYLRGDPSNAFGKVRLTITRVPGVGTSAPRAVGVLAPATWRKSWELQVDLTKPVKAGHLEIRDAGGRLIRSIRTPSSADGGLRHLRWDGRDSTGAKVPAGTYTYLVTNAAKDGSGRPVRSDGSGGAIGSVRVG